MPKATARKKPTTKRGPNPAEAILHPVRLRIVQCLAAAKSATPALLQETLSDVAPASLYRHLNKLLEAGVVVVTGERKVRGAVERAFSLAAGEGHLTQADIQHATIEDHERWFLTFTLGLFDKFSRYLHRPKPGKRKKKSPPNFEEDGVGYHTAPLWLSDEEFAAFAAELSRVVRKAAENAPEEGRVLRSYSTILMPEVDVPKAPPDDDGL